jgi:hypothetical protein
MFDDDDEDFAPASKSEVKFASAPKQRGRPRGSSSNRNQPKPRVNAFAQAPVRGEPIQRQQPIRLIRPPMPTFKYASTTSSNYATINENRPLKMIVMR